MNTALEKPEVLTRETAEYYNDLASTIFFPVYPVIAHQILKETDIDSGTCIDVGSGPGHLAIALATLSDLTVFALDNDASMFRIARDNIRKYRLERRVRPVHSDVHSIPFDDKSMDLVVSRESFFFWDNLARGFAECRRVLKPGGRAVIGGGFGNTRLRSEISEKMQTEDPEWEEKQRGWYNDCNPRIVRSALADAGISGYDLTEDERGYWVRFGRRK